MVWQPLPGSQSFAVSSPCNITLYEGTRGPGKTDAQLMFFRRFVGLGYGSRWRGVIFDREYKNLDDLISKSYRWFPEFQDGATFLRSASAYRWVWPTGEQLLFRQIKRASDYMGYHGQEFPYIGWNELTKYPTSELFDLMMSCNRSSFLPERHSPNPLVPLPELPLVVFATTNPHGPGHAWVKRRFIDVAPPGKVVREVTNVFNPRTKKQENVTKTQIRIFGTYKENTYLNPEYVAELEKTPDPERRKAWLNGDWDIVAGGALDDVWSRVHTVIPRFKIPKGWKLDRSLDWGSTRPFSVGWWGEANGEEVILPGGRKWSPPKGSLIRFAEWYGSRAVGTNTGLKLGAKEVAEGIVERELVFRSQKWIDAEEPIFAGPADSAIYNPQEDQVSIAELMASRGVRWTKSIKSPGSRKNGLELVRGALLNARKREGPGLWIMENCTATISTLPILPRDPEDSDDVDTDAEDHAYDEVRYRVLAGALKYPFSLKATFAS